MTSTMQHKVWNLLGTGRELDVEGLWRLARHASVNEALVEREVSASTSLTDQSLSFCQPMR
jgi:hypothetical protein